MPLYGYYFDPTYILIIIGVRFHRICHAPPVRGVLQTAPGGAVITPQHRFERMPQGSVASPWTGVSKFHYPLRSHRARCAKIGSRTYVDRSVSLSITS